MLFSPRKSARWLRGRDLNPRPSGYEPDELPGCSTPQSNFQIPALITPIPRRRDYEPDELPGCSTPQSNFQITASLCHSIDPASGGIMSLTSRYRAAPPRSQIFKCSLKSPTIPPWRDYEPDELPGCSTPQSNFHITALSHPRSRLGGIMSLTSYRAAPPRDSGDRDQGSGIRGGLWVGVRDRIRLI